MRVRVCVLRPTVIIAVILIIYITYFSPIVVFQPRNKVVDSHSSHSSELSIESTLDFG